MPNVLHTPCANLIYLHRRACASLAGDSDVASVSLKDGAILIDW